MPYHNLLAPADADKTAWYACRRINTSGEPGPWSVVTGYPAV